MSSTSILTYVVLTLIVGYVFVYSPFGEVSILMNEKDKYKNYLDLVTDVEEKKNVLLAEFNKISTVDKQSINTVLPDSLDFVRLISQIDNVASRQGLSINQTSSKEVDLAVGGTIGEAQAQKSYKSATISFSFSASYEKFNVFMADLEKSLRILDIRSAKISTSDKGVYLYTVEFETYWLKS